MNLNDTRARVRAAALLLAGAVAAGAEPAAACSLMMHPTSLSGPVVLATALPDTVAARSLPPEYRRYLGPEGAERMYGQAARVERAAGPGAALLREALRSGDGTVVMIPWGTMPDCTPVPWEMGARWVAPGTRAVFHGRLRHPRFWVDGRPTLDLFAPAALPFVPAGTDRRPAEVDEYFELASRLPSVAEAWHDPDALRPLLAWARAHPGRAAREPAASTLAYAAAEAEHARVYRLETPLMGTWRLTVSRPGRPDVTFFARTARHPQAWIPPVPGGSAAGPRRAPGYILRADVAPSLETLPRAADEAQWSGVAMAMIALEEPAASGAGERTWPGRIALSPGYGPLTPGEEIGEVWRTITAAEAPRDDTLPAVFLLRRDGSVTVEQRVEAGGRPVAVIRGHKVSDRRAPWDESERPTY